MIGGSADLTGSNNTDWSGNKAIVLKIFSRKLLIIRRARIRYGRDYEWNCGTWWFYSLWWYFF